MLNLFLSFLLVLNSPVYASRTELGISAIPTIQQKEALAALENLTCEELKDDFASNRLNLVEVLLGVMFPGYAQFVRGEISEGAVFAGAAVATAVAASMS